MALEMLGEGGGAYVCPSVLPGGGSIDAMAAATVCVVSSVLVLSASCTILNMPHWLLFVYPCCPEVAFMLSAVSLFVYRLWKNVFITGQVITMSP